MDRHNSRRALSEESDRIPPSQIAPPSTPDVSEIPPPPRRGARAGSISSLIEDAQRDRDDLNAGPRPKRAKHTEEPQIQSVLGRLVDQLDSQSRLLSNMSSAREKPRQEGNASYRSRSPVVDLTVPSPLAAAIQPSPMVQGGANSSGWETLVAQDNAPQQIPRLDQGSSSRRRSLTKRRLDPYETDSTDEETGRKGRRPIKSVFARKATDDVKKKVLAPHLYIYRGLKPVQYDQLSIAEFVLGYCKMVREMPNLAICMSSMLYILKIVMQDAVNNSWHSTLEIFQTVLLEIEKDRLQWSDIYNIQAIMTRERLNKHNKDISTPETQPPRSSFMTPPAAHNSQNSSFSNKKRPCPRFQKSDCTYGFRHVYRGNYVEHICAICARSNKSERHPATKCPSKKASPRSPKK